MSVKIPIHGKKILGFPYGNMEIENYSCDFYIDNDSHYFIIEDNNYPTVSALELRFKNEAVHKDCLFCLDEDGIAFTVYDCFIMPMQIPVKQIKVVWNKYLWGYHIKELQNEKICSAEYIVQADKYPLEMFVGKTEFDVLDGKVHITTDWYQENNYFKGVSIGILLKKAVPIDEVEVMVLRLLEIYYLSVGFFPKVMSRKMLSIENKAYWIEEEFATYGKTTKKNIRLDFVLDVNSNSDYSSAYDKWWNLREKDVATFNLFSYLTTESTPVRELPIVTCMQCFEGYFRIHHSSELYRFPDSAKKQIQKEVLKLLNFSEDLQKICEENEIELEKIKDSFISVSGHINEYSLKEILLYAIDRCQSAQMLFEYERTININAKTTIMDLFIRKATGHRNWLSHLITQKYCFKGKEIEIAYKKLSLLFRLTLLHDIGLEVTEESLIKIIKRINKWYENNQFE